MSSCPAGDSRAILVRKSGVVPLSWDHKPYNVRRLIFLCVHCSLVLCVLAVSEPDAHVSLLPMLLLVVQEGEQRRIVAAGGTVSMRRVNGDLAVSRALGDFVYKQASSLKDEEQQVTASPDIHVHPRDVDEDEYLVVACDGIWDVFTNEECGKWVKETVAGGCASLTDLCEAMLDEGLKRNSKDNMSVLIVKFPAADAPSEYVAAP